jgi:hypothetical protein
LIHRIKRSFVARTLLNSIRSAAVQIAKTDRRKSYPLERSNLGKVNLQLVANKEKKNGAQGGEDDASRMKSGIGRPRKHVDDSTTDD